MKLLFHISIDNVMIDVWQDDDGTIILGGIGWYEYNDYGKLEKHKKQAKLEKHQS